ncbi:MAG: recombination protein RecR [Candidatus Omnitrophota bacterium]|nr:MAG: recombination protein RecR [Candidatus Omnitrophota bacterium]
MQEYPLSLQNLIEKLSKFPTIGFKSAERMALHLLKGSYADAEAFAQAVIEAKQRTKKCKLCNYFAEKDLCLICQKRVQRENVICIVEEPQDVITIERTARYKGLYYVLWGRLSPLGGIGPVNLPLKHLLARVKMDKLEEVIIATSSSREGEITALYLKRLLLPLKIKITQIARGIPVGSNIWHVDQATMSEAIAGRR